jgi:Protein of unknown function (DUF3455)
MNRLTAITFLVSQCWVLAACGGSAGVKSDVKAGVAASLQAPEGQVLTQQLHAVGVQIYVCQPAKSDASRFEWAFKAPEADLFAGAHQKVGRHYAGPSWEAADGSKVVGAVVAKETPDPSAIPWLLLSSKSSSGIGIFTAVRSIQRLHTVGGNAPSSGCDPAQRGQELRTADYLFYC